MSEELFTLELTRAEIFLLRQALDSHTRKYCDIGIAECRPIIQATSDLDRKIYDDTGVQFLNAKDEPDED